MILLEEEVVKYGMGPGCRNRIHVEMRSLGSIGRSHVVNHRCIYYAHLQGQDNRQGYQRGVIKCQEIERANENNVFPIAQPIHDRIKVALSIEIQC